MALPSFGDVRAWLHAPNAASWQRICDLCEYAGHDTFEREFRSYLEHHLLTWPADVARAPSRWVDLWLKGQPVPQLAFARSLVWQDAKMNAAQAQRLAAFEPWQLLASLELANNTLRDMGIDALTAPGTFPQLRRLVLRQNQIGWIGMNDLVESELLSGLEELDLSINHVGDAWSARLLRSGRLGQLRSLDLSWTMASTEAAEALGEMLSQMPALRVVKLGRNPSTLAMAEILLERELLEQLDVLDVAPCAMPEQRRGFYETLARDCGCEVRW